VRAAASRVTPYLALVPGGLLFGALFGFALALIALYSFWTVVDFEVVPNWSLDNYQYLLSVPTYRRTAIATLWMSGLATLLTLLLAFPFAYWLARYAPARWRRALLIAAVLPFFASYLLRIFAWISILGENGAINQFLQWSGLASEPVSLFLNDRPAVILVLIYVYYPFAVLALYVALEQFDWELLKAARDLGASGFRAIAEVLLPLIRPGLVTAVIVTFIPMLGEYVTPLLVGGTKGVMFGNLVANFFDGGEYARGAAAALLMALVVASLLVLVRRSFTIGPADEPRV
jgi:spermidine/putrescine transport system permease protein